MFGALLALGAGAIAYAALETPQRKEAPSPKPTTDVFDPIELFERGRKAGLLEAEQEHKRLVADQERLAKLNESEQTDE